MPSALTWRALPVANVATLTDIGYITAIKTMFDSATYADGSTRTGTSTAWTTATLSDGSLKLTAPNNPLGLIAHFTPATLSTNIPKAFGEVVYNTTGRVLGTIVLNPGTYASNTVTPWGASARCFGYSHMSPLYAANTSTGNPSTSEVSTGASISNYTQVVLRAWESQDAIVMHVWTSSLYGNIHVLGGWLAPDSSMASTADAETDGVLYGLMSSGNNGWVQNYRGNFYYYEKGFAVGSYISSFTQNPTSDVTNGYARPMHPRCAVFLPGLQTPVEINRAGSFRPSNSLLLTSGEGKLAKMPMYFCSSDRMMGKAREMFMFNPSINGLTLRSGGSGGTDKGYIVSFSNNAAYDSFVLAV